MAGDLLKKCLQYNKVRAELLHWYLACVSFLHCQRRVVAHCYFFLCDLESPVLVCMQILLIYIPLLTNHEDISAHHPVLYFVIPPF